MNESVVYQLLTASTTLDGLVGDRIYPSNARPNAAYPRIVYAAPLIAPAPDFEVPDIDNYFVQVDVYARTRAAVLDICEQVQSILEQYGVLRSVALDEFQPDAKIYRRALSFSLWLERDGLLPQPPVVLPEPGPPGSGTDITRVAAATINGHRVVMSSGAGEVLHLNALVAANADQVLGVSLNASLAVGAVSIRTYGQIDEASWAWTPQESVYVTGDGLLTQTVPTAPDAFVLRIGFAESATRLFVDIDQPIYL